jgi:hypothetical protein
MTDCSLYVLDSEMHTSLHQHSIKAEIITLAILNRIGVQILPFNAEVITLPWPRKIFFFNYYALLHTAFYGRIVVVNYDSSK